MPCIGFGPVVVIVLLSLSFIVKLGLILSIEHFSSSLTTCTGVAPTLKSSLPYVVYMGKKQTYTLTGNVNSVSVNANEVASMDTCIPIVDAFIAKYYYDDKATGPKLSMADPWAIGIIDDLRPPYVINMQVSPVDIQFGGSGTTGGVVRNANRVIIVTADMHCGNISCQTFWNLLYLRLGVLFGKLSPAADLPQPDARVWPDDAAWTQGTGEVLGSAEGVPWISFDRRWDKGDMLQTCKFFNDRIGNGKLTYSS